MANSETGAPAPAIAPTACDREPIHAPGSVQPHGVLLALREADLAVVQASANDADLLGRPALGAGLAELFGPEEAGALRAGMTGRALDDGPLYLRTVTVPVGGQDRSFHAVANRSDGALILEL